MSTRSDEGRTPSTSSRRTLGIRRHTVHLHVRTGVPREQVAPGPKRRWESHEPSTFVSLSASLTPRLLKVLKNGREVVVQRIWRRCVCRLIQAVTSMASSGLSRVASTRGYLSRCRTRCIQRSIRNSGRSFIVSKQSVDVQLPVCVDVRI